MPEPSSDARPSLVSNLTTLGTTLAATCSTVPIGALTAGMLRPLGAGLVIVVVDRPSGWAVIATMPPTAADTAAIAKVPTVIATGRSRRLRAGGDIVAAPTGRGV